MPEEFYACVYGDKVLLELFFSVELTSLAEDEEALFELYILAEFSSDNIVEEA